MLTRFVRIQLVVFTIASIVGVLVMVFNYLQAPTLLGVGRITVTLELPSTGGLYRFSNVTYRGVQIGKVTAVRLTREGAKATLSLNSSPLIPADVQADVRSVSAVGEQYVDLRPRSDSPPYLRDGSLIAMTDTTIPQAVGPLLDQTSSLIGSIPKDKLGELLDESFRAFNGAGYDLGSLIDSSARFTSDLNGASDRTRTLVQDAVPLLDSQADTTDAIRTWTRSLAGITGQLVTNDPQVRTVLRDAPGAANEASSLLDQIKPTLPVLLANLTTIGQVAVTYRPSLEQVLVLLPPFVANILSAAPDHNPTGIGQGDFAITEGDPPSCTAGFLPPNQWRSPEDTTEVDTPDGLYCKLPQDSPIAVRGARNYPCIGQPGKRAPTVEICNNDKPYQPLAMRQHLLGPYPLDPNLIAQGVPLDDRINGDDHLYAPVEGTPRSPLPGPPVPAGEPPVPAAASDSGASVPPEAPGPPPAAVPPPLDIGGGVPAAPSAFSGNRSVPGPSLAFAQYDPATGRYVTPDGLTYQQSDLVAPGATKTWKDLILTEHT
ncbi:MlaD family protein [Mycobacterium sp.]|uniref:MlaD family protein n=1 Tax=Mycobacterium sp. TaxID=1785 RepID=UPI002D979307|nr:MlaD family protein [Mycobacterium sp.]